MQKTFYTMRTLIVLLFVFGCFGAVTLKAQNATLSVQGILKKSDGSAVPDDVYTVRFSLWTADVGGTEVWFESISDVETIGGVYSVVLGAGGTTLNAPFNVPYYLGVRVGSSTQELLPRPRLTAAPYAMSLLGADNVVPSTGNIQAYGLTASHNITAAGNISATGTISASSWYGDINVNGAVYGQSNVQCVGGMLSSIGSINSGTGPFHGYGFTGDGGTGYGSNAYGIASVWAGGQNVMNATNQEVTLTKFTKITGLKTLSYTGQVRSMSGSGFETLSNYNAPFSLETDGYIKPYGVYVISDRRVKKDFVQSDIAGDLATLLRLRVTDYKYKDVIGKGEGWKKGFVAQEVEQIVPEAVSSNTEVIPDIYASTQDVRFEAGLLHLSLAQPHGLKTGDKVRIMAGEHQEDLSVAAVNSATAFALSGWTHATPEGVFVFGREVSDFRSVDYDRLFTLNISATQELARRVESLEQENAAFKSENAELRRMLESLRADVNALKAQR